MWLFFLRQFLDTWRSAWKGTTLVMFLSVYVIASFSLATVEKPETQIYISTQMGSMHGQLFLSLLGRNLTSRPKFCDWFLIEYISCSQISLRFQYFILTITRNLFNWQFELISHYIQLFITSLENIGWIRFPVRSNAAKFHYFANSGGTWSSPPTTKNKLMTVSQTL